MATLALEQRIGRKLTAAEEHIAVEAIDGLLNDAKDELERLIVAEQRRLARAIADGHTGRMNVTDQMLRALRALRAAGREHALAELVSMGYPVSSARRHATDGELDGQLRARLGQLTIKVQREAVGLDLGQLSADAIQRSLEKVLGARSIAADLVSPVFVSGLADTFEQHADVVAAWQYTAVNDSGLCEQCAPWDGEIFDTLDALFDVLPNFGPNPDCDGGDRCRCRAVPVPPAEAPPPSTSPGVAPSSILDIKGGSRGALVERRETIEETLVGLDQLIKLPDGQLAENVNVTMRKTTSARGHMKYDSNGVPLEINIASDSHPAVTFAHEFGHLVDLSYLGRPGSLATRNPAAVEGQLGEALRDLDRAWKESDSYQQLDTLQGDSLSRYMRSRAELWARSFSQWAANRSGGRLREQMLADIDAERAKVATLGDVPGWRFYPETWQPDDFAEIDAAITRVLRAADLLR